MGNPHLIFFVNNLNSIPLSELGPIFEKDSHFPDKTNVHFCQILDDQNIKVIVWERGSGATLACGTGACAVHVAAYKLGLCSKKSKIILPGGELIIDWNDIRNDVFMTGKAKKTFDGIYHLDI